MNISSLFIQRPIATTLAMLSILLLGVVAYRMLPVSDLPNVDFPTISVSASLPGASPETMATAVATPLEKEFCTIDGIDTMSSSSQTGSTSITIQFKLDRNIDAAAQDVQAAISRAVRKLPGTMTTPPSYRKVNPADDPILWLTLTSPTAPMYELDELGQTLMAQRISMVSGVAQVQVYGGQKYAVRLEVDPYALASRGIGIDEVASAIAQQNVSNPLGVLSGRYQSNTIEDNGQLMNMANPRASAEVYSSVIIANRNGQPVRLQDVGRATDSVENDKIAAWFFSRELSDSQAADAPAAMPSASAAKGAQAAKPQMMRAIVLAIQRQPGTNTVEVAKNVKALIPEFQKQLPASVNLRVLRDSSVWIAESARDVEFTLVLTLGLVVMVIFLFLRNFWATVIPSLVLPISVIGTFAVMYALNYSLDNLSLMALTLSVGFVVDDAIVMLENIVRHMEMGKPRMQAALDGSKEIGFTIVSMTLSLAAVFIPFLLMGGLVGRLFREFSVTIGAAVIVSGFVSLTLTPMLASKLLKNQHQRHHNALYRASEWCFEAMLKVYALILRGALNGKRVKMLVSVVILGGTVWLFMNIPQDFIPTEDRDQFRVRTEGPQDVSYEAMMASQKRVADLIMADPDVDRFMCSVGGGGAVGGSSNSGQLFVIVKPKDQRKRSLDQIVADVRGRLSRVEGLKVYITNPPSINLGGRMSKGLYQMTLQCPDTASLYAYGDTLEQMLRDMPMLVDVSSDMQLKNPQLNVKIDRDRASAMKVTPQCVENALLYSYSTAQVTTLLAPNNQYQVIMELLPQFQTDPALLSRVYVRSTAGNLVPLTAVTAMSQEVGPLLVNHTGQLPSVTVSFNLAPGVSLGDATTAIEKAIRSSKVPPGLSYGFQGTAQAFQDSMKSMGYLLIMAVVVIYIVLGILYESFYHPITILSALPFAAFGALLTLKLFNVPLSIYAYVGIIMLVGLVKKNGIMMIDFALQSQREGKNARDSIYDACLVRFRPIMMTTVAALMAGLPIALGMGAGAESRRPLGLAVVGGLLFSQTLTLFVTPVFFLYMEKFRLAMAALFGRGGQAGDGSATPPRLPDDRTAAPVPVAAE